ncbi:MAG TPA: class I adenylate-forming enzyme family protein [Acidimicrobiia bacterium]|nr:class I adenylate-forming enzyme family protein [Acidimicrobiia bacterium]
MPTYEEIDATLTAPGQFFEIEHVEVHGNPVRVWKNAPGSLREVFITSLAHPADRSFLVLGDERVGYGEHARRVVSLAHRLVHDFGVQPGDRVAIAMRNYPEWSVAFFAATAVGAVAVPLNAWWTGGELAFAISDSGARVVVADGDRLARLASRLADLEVETLLGVRLDDRPADSALPASVLPMEVSATGHDLPEVGVAPDDDATIFYTSGTTGRPKGVVGTHRNICTNLVNLMYVGARSAMRTGGSTGGRAPADPPVVLVPVPLFHATGCHSVLVAQLFFGGTIVFMRRWDPSQAVELIEREGVTSLTGVPAMTWELLGVPDLDSRDLSSLRSLGGGGAAAPPEIVRRVQQLLPGRGVSTGYGLTETSSLVSSNSGPDYAERPRSVGVPVPVCEVRVVGPSGEQLPTGAEGEVWIRGPNVVKGYWERPEETAATFTDGWCHTGDIGRFDGDGFLSIVDRAKDIVIRGGENISSAEVEAALFEHPSVADAAVVGVPHPVLGEEVAAVVQLRPGGSADPDALRAHVAERLAAFKVPQVIVFRDEPLPRNPAGKVLKRELRDEIAR